MTGKVLTRKPATIGWTGKRADKVIDILDLVDNRNTIVTLLLCEQCTVE